MAGLPNITGSIFGFKWGTTHYYHTSGALYTIGEELPQRLESIAKTDTGFILSIAANKSNTIYGKSSVVTPLSRECLFLLKY